MKLIIYLFIVLFSVNSHAQWNFWKGVLTLCNTGTHKENGKCVSNVQNCSIANGSGNQTWNGSNYGSCMVASCNGGFVSYNNSCVRPGIYVTSASYGTNCNGNLAGNRTSVVASECNTKSSCSVNPLAWGDPHGGCVKYFYVDYTCYGSARNYAWTANEAGGKNHTLSCQ